jgi:diguanylate cyclase (GGDEF)-like protein
MLSPAIGALAARPPSGSGSPPRAPASSTVALVWVALYALGILLSRGHHTAELVVRDGVYLVPIALAAVLAIRAARARSGSIRAFWALLATSNALWLAGELVWGAYEVVARSEPPFPSVADALYMGSYALVIPAVVLGFRTTSLWRTARGLLDASAVVVAVGVSGWLVLIRPQLTGGWGLATATGIGYPLLGVLILMVLFLVAFGGRTSVPRSIRLVAVAFGISAATDAAYTYVAVLHDLVDGVWLNVGWQAEAALLCAAAHVAAGRERAPAPAASTGRDRGLPIVVLGVVLTAAVVVIDGRAHRGSLSLPVIALLTYAVLALLMRLHLTARDKDAIAQELQRSLAKQEQLALTDALTSLHNRRFFEEVLRLEGERASRSGSSLAVIVIDLDHFKHVNDTFGHQAGDEVLRTAAVRLSSVVRGGDVLARYGGEEFVAVLPDTGAHTAGQVAERYRRAIGATPVIVGDRTSIRVTASVGVAVLPVHAATTEELLQAADNALYIAKRLGRNQTRVGTLGLDDSLSQVAGDNRVVEYLQQLADDIDSRQAAQEHSLAMARWASRIAERLALPEQQAWRTVLATRLHDIGKVTVPDAILTKPAALTAEEWAIIREHPEQGARLVSLDPLLAAVADAIHDHHERYDGQGYPRRRAGESISVEARIIAVCDAWAAMRATRAYRPALAVEDARRELAAGRGTQFDPAVVDAFLELEADGHVGDLEAPHTSVITG